MARVLADFFCGLILAEAGLQPVLIERGQPVNQRIQDFNRLMETGVLNPESNIQFGEGGAGTFSDGKLYTLINDPRTQYIFDQLIQAGAPSEIAWDAKPHIGTDKLQGVVSTLKEKIIDLGGNVLFNTRMTDCVIVDQRIQAIEINSKDQITTELLILAIGHSSRDTVEMLFNHGINMVPKAFSMGVRIEHLRDWIQKSQYGNFCNDHRLPAAKYKMAVQLTNDRGAYTFCMCPGGFVVPAASEPGGVVTNGMSLHAQNGENSNSALLVNVTPDDFGSHPLDGIAFQRKFERKAFIHGGGDFAAPVQLLGDFLNDRLSRKFKKVFPTYQPDTQFADLRECLPDFVIQNLKASIPLLNNKVKGFSHPDAILTGVETRSSSPVRILRNETMQSNILGIFPAGEGAGYAGGIVSSALDGMRIAEKILSDF
ncbi:NAD(P)/FAD-dependent oxidoreductase [bacterium]